MDDETYQKYLIEKRNQDKAFVAEMGEEGIRIRKEYLIDQLKLYNKLVTNAYLNDAELRKENQPFWYREAILTLRCVRENEAKIKQLELQLRRLDIKKDIVTIDVKGIKESLDINTIVKLNARGFINCPFHVDKTPSMKWNEKKKYFHCFSCGWHGDIISFLMKRDNISFKEAINIIR